MKKIALTALMITVFILFSCTKDDSSIYPKELKFVESQFLDFKMWVGGVEVSTDGIDPEQIFSDESFEFLEENQEMEQEVTYIFKSEYQLEVHQGTIYFGSEYFIRNDSIFITGFLDEPQFLCVGNLDKLTFYSGQFYVKFTYENGYGSSSGSFGMYITVDDILNEIEYYSNLEDMGENDTIAIMNSLSVFE